MIVILFLLSFPSPSLLRLLYCCCFAYALLLLCRSPPRCCCCIVFVVLLVALISVLHSVVVRRVLRGGVVLHGILVLLGVVVSRPSRCRQVLARGSEQEDEEREEVITMGEDGPKWKEVQQCK